MLASGCLFDLVCYFLEVILQRHKRSHWLNIWGFFFYSSHYPALWPTLSQNGPGSNLHNFL